MTTIAWTPGLLVADTCVTHSDESAAPFYRSRMQKIVFREFHTQGVTNTLAVASKGDASIGTKLDELVLTQGLAVIRCRKFSGYFSVDMNKARFLKARRDAIADGEFAQLIVWFTSGGDYCYYMDESAYVKRVEQGYIAIGSDSGPALGSLRAGKDAVFAVESAAMFGVYTAKPLHVLQHNGKAVLREIA